MERILQMDSDEVDRLKEAWVFLLVQGADLGDTIGQAAWLIQRFCQALGLQFVSSAATTNELNEP